MFQTSFLNVKVKLSIMAPAIELGLNHFRPPPKPGCVPPLKMWLCWPKVESAEFHHVSFIFIWAHMSFGSSCSWLWIALAIHQRLEANWHSLELKRQFHHFCCCLKRDNNTVSIKSNRSGRKVHRKVNDTTRHYLMIRNDSNTFQEWIRWIRRIHHFSGQKARGKLRSDGERKRSLKMSAKLRCWTGAKSWTACCERSTVIAARRFFRDHTCRAVCE